MRSKILLTSFDIWLPHHQSNSSDDLLEIISQLEFNLVSLNFMRKLPVNVDRTSELVIDKINNLQPDAIICCGMAESRQQLSIESSASCERDCAPRPKPIGINRLRDRITTSLDLEKLISKLSATYISHDAGKFVCEGLYYQVLNYLRSNQLNSQCIFVHVPLLNSNNFPEIVDNFKSILKLVSRS
jgi:pyroglutamyl-peptidase